MFLRGASASSAKTILLQVGKLKKNKVERLGAGLEKDQATGLEQPSPEALYTPAHAMQRMEQCMAGTTG